uniref:Putative 8.9 kDa family member n=1 Tax=Rhipicephalus pulchellus TaxID=72859 RepID=L7MAC9_RHIPC
MKKIVPFLILAAIFFQISHSNEAKKVKKTKKPTYVDVPVPTVDGQCKYHDKYFLRSSMHFLETPCEWIFCNPDANEVTIKGCPPPKNATFHPTGNKWPNCCLNKSKKN